VARLGRARRASAEALFTRLDRPRAEQLRELLATLLDREPAARGGATPATALTPPTGAPPASPATPATAATPPGGAAS
jgi:hypothetical protein